MILTCLGYPAGTIQNGLPLLAIPGRGGRYKFNETRKSVGYVGKVGTRPFGGPVRVFFLGGELA